MSSSSKPKIDENKLNDITDKKYREIFKILLVSAMYNILFEIKPKIKEIEIENKINENKINEKVNNLKTKKSLTVNNNDIYHYLKNISDLRSLDEQINFIKHKIN